MTRYLIHARMSLAQIRRALAASRGVTVVWGVHGVAADRGWSIREDGVPVDFVAEAEGKNVLKARLLRLGRGA